MYKLLFLMVVFVCGLSVAQERPQGTFPKKKPPQNKIILNTSPNYIIIKDSKGVTHIYIKSPNTNLKPIKKPK